MNSRIILLATALVAAPLVASAQNAEVNQRLENQSDRIDQGLAHDRLNVNQAQRLQAHDNRVLAQEQRMSARDGGGPLTGHQDRVLNHELNRNSARIYDEKHE